MTEPETNETAAWQVVLDASERRRIALRLGGDLAGAGLLAVGFGLSLWRPDQAQVAALVQATAALVVAVPVLVRGLPALVALRPRDTTDQLVSLAVLAAMAQGSFVTATLVPLVLDVGRLFEERTSLGTRAAIAGLRQLQERVRSAALLDEAGQETEVEVAALRPGDRIRVRPGQVFGVDGRVLRGTSVVDQAPITGESRPEEVAAGTDVFAGTLNLSGLVEVEVTGAGSDTVLGRVAAMLRKVVDARPPVVRTLERLGAAYVPVVLALAATTLFFTESVERAITVLVVAAPTALVVAGPAAMVAAMSAASRRDILVKSAAFLEAATQVDALVIDKTGTLTDGRLAVAAVHPADGLSEDEVVAIAAACGHGSLHPVSRAAVLAARQRGLQLAEIESLEEAHGRGAEARVGGRVLRFGRLTWLAECGVAVPADVPGTGVAEDGRWVGSLEMRDTIRVDAAEALAELRAAGITRVVLATGDRRAEAERVAAELGIDEVVAEVLPEAKLDVVRGEQEAGHKVLMVGDGVNDALAMAQADVGVAIGARINEVALGGSDVALLSDALNRVPELLALARRTRQVVWGNLAISLGVGGVLLAGAMLGKLSPLTGALLHDLSALLVVAHSARLLTTHKRPQAEQPAGAS